MRSVHHPFGSMLLVGAAALLLTACSPLTSRHTIPAGSDRALDLSIEAMSFVPDRLEVKVGETVTFFISNPRDDPHEAFIGSAADQLIHETAHQAIAAGKQASMAHMGYGIFIDAHGSGTLTYHFAKTGTILIGCHLPGHYAAGMVAAIIVEP